MRISDWSSDVCSSDLVGRDVSIIGFDDIAMAAWPSHSLTTYSPPIKLMVQRLTSIVQRLLRDPNYPPTATIVPGRLVVLGSARVPPTGILQDDAGLYRRSLSTFEESPEAEETPQ